MKICEDDGGYHRYYGCRWWCVVNGRDFGGSCHSSWTCCCETVPKSSHTLVIGRAADGEFK